eukprot:TRINITY_DN6984_c0_g1_i1.p1 TRINITY_DN6984_c0_g1~~TRINITY_DN6984_c0_g1_i1.p1  ORF type:complete len:173 (+),score=40.85 TRINITY_DN6984_c0_g1_i1:135-653(+)
MCIRDSSNSKVYFKSEEKTTTLEAEWDWCVKRKNLRMAMLGTLSIFLALLQIELAYDTENFMYRVGSTRGKILKGTSSLLTLMLMYMIYDYYDYQVVGQKKNWYIQLYRGKRPGNLPRGILSSSLWSAFLLELVVCLVHVPPCLDFRYWVIPEGKTNAVSYTHLTLPTIYSV